jgi:hypothetical protein
MTIKVNLYGNTFNHNIINNKISSTLGKHPKNIEYVLDGSGSINIFIDRSVYDVHKVNNGKTNFAWLIESNIATDLVQYFKNLTLEDKKIFEYIFTHNKDLLSLNSNFRFLNPIGYWVEDDLTIEKTKVVSMVLSDKKYTKQQINRLKFAKDNKNSIDIFGSGLHPIAKKEIGLNNYCFSVVFENAISDDYFSEKILDCFATKTIPIYSGTKNITNYFDRNGIIFIEDFNIEDLTFSFYEQKINAVNNNFQTVKNYRIPEDLMYKKYLI